MATINLGKKWNTACCPQPAKNDSKMSYPRVYIDGVKGLDLETGPITFTAKGRVISKSERETENEETYSCEIEIHEISTDSGDGLDGAMKKIAAKKMADMEDDE